MLERKKLKSRNPIVLDFFSEIYRRTYILKNVAPSIEKCVYIRIANFVEGNASTWKMWERYLLNRKVSKLSFGNIKVKDSPHIKHEFLTLKSIIEFSKPDRKIYILYKIHLYTRKP